MARRLLFQVIAFVGLLLLALIGYFYLMMRPITCAPICVGVNLAGRDLRGLNLQTVNFVEANLTDADLRGADLRESDFSGALLVGANLRNTNLTDAKMIGTDLTRADLNESLLKGADLSGAILREADLTGLDLTETVLNGGSFPKAKLTGVNLQNANLTGVDFSNANLSGADFTNANLSGSRLSQADVSGAHLANALLVGGWLNLTNLTGADLSGANLVGSQIIGGRLTSADLSHSNLQGTVTIGASFDGANLRGANLQQMQVTPAQLNPSALRIDPALTTLNELQRNALLIDVNLSGVQYDERTQWSKNLSPLGVISMTEALTATINPLSATQTITAATAFSSTSTVDLDASTSLTASEFLTTPVKLALDSTAEALFDRPAAKVVKFNLFLNSLDNIDELANTFDADFYVDLSWQENSSVPNRLEPQASGEATPAALFDPAIEVVNAKSVDTVHRFYAPSLETDSNIRLHTWLRGRLTSPFDLHDFPFDRQHLAINIESAELDSEHLVFNFTGVQQPPEPSEEPFIQPIPKGRYVALDAVGGGWGIEQVSAAQQVRVIGYDNSSWSQARIELTLRRITVPYLRRMLLALVLLLLLAWGIFWVDVHDLHLRLWLLFVLFIVVNVFNIMLWQKLPNLPYLTFLDRTLLCAYGTIVELAFVSLVSFWLTKRGWHKVQRWFNRGMVIVYPVGLGVMTFALFGSLGN